MKQIEISISVLQRKALTPDDFPSFNEIAARILDFREPFQLVAEPFE